jgi:hypothetical protein
MSKANFGLASDLIVDFLQFRREEKIKCFLVLLRSLRPLH